MFASPGNHEIPNFVSRYPHWQAMEVDVLKCPLENIQCCYANPPWSVIGKWLHRLRENNKVDLHDDNPLLGFSTTVAPTNKTAG